LFHPVHGGAAIVNFTDLVIDTGVEKDALSSRGFTRVDVRHDSDIANLGEVDCCISGHLNDPLNSYC